MRSRVGLTPIAHVIRAFPDARGVISRRPREHTPFRGRKAAASWRFAHFGGTTSYAVAVNNASDVLPYSLAYGDLDHFKQLNDVFGHDAGDRALRTFSQVLRDALRPSDIPCRYGGEEFVIMLPSCTIDEAVVVLERVRERIALRLASGHLPTFTVSFGLASSDQAEDFQHVVSLADDALLRAKAGGRDQIVVARSGEPAGPTLTSAIDRSGPTPPADAPDSARSATPLLLVTPS